MRTDCAGNERKRLKQGKKATKRLNSFDNTSARVSKRDDCTGKGPKTFNKGNRDNDTYNAPQSFIYASAKDFENGACYNQLFSSGNVLIQCSCTIQCVRLFTIYIFEQFQYKDQVQLQF